MKVTGNGTITRRSTVATTTSVRTGRWFVDRMQRCRGMIVTGSLYIGLAVMPSPPDSSWISLVFAFSPAASSLNAAIRAPCSFARSASRLHVARSQMMATFSSRKKGPRMLCIVCMISPLPAGWVSA